MLLWLLVVTFLVLDARASRFQLNIFDVESSHPLDVCDTGTADFGGSMERLFELGIKSCAVVVDPTDACRPIRVARPLAKCASHYVLVKRSSRKNPCHFSLQAYHVEQYKNLSVTAVVFVNYPSELLPIDFTGSEYADKVHVPVFMIADRCAQIILESKQANRIRMAIEDLGYVENALYYLIPIFAFIILMLVVSFSAWLVRCCRQQQKNRQRRLQVRKLKSLPTRRFRVGESLDQCVICVESFIPNEKMRILPCQHCFHSKCVDSWLTSFKKTCPLCKMTVDLEEIPDDARRQFTVDVERSQDDDNSAEFENGENESFLSTDSNEQNVSTEQLIPSTSNANV